jgi:hypothetical protein
MHQYIVKLPLCYQFIILVLCSFAFLVCFLLYQHLISIIQFYNRIAPLLLYHHQIAIYSKLLFPPCQTTISIQIVPSAQYRCYCACTIIEFESTADLQQSAISTMPIYYFHPNSTIHMVQLLLYHHQLQSTAVCYFYHVNCKSTITIGIVPSK